MSEVKVNKISPRSGTDVTLGDSGDTITVPTGVTLDTSNSTVTLPDGSVSLAKLSASGTKDATTFLRGDNTFAEAGGGITEADMFRLTADLSTNADPISSNLERVDDATFSKIGTGMTLSSGVYTFPSTGLYYVVMNAKINHSGGDTVVLDMQVSSDSGSTYDTVSGISFYQTSDDHLGTNNAFVNVTNASTFRIKFTTSSWVLATLRGNTDSNQTSFTFIRLGDSQ